MRASHSKPCVKANAFVRAERLLLESEGAWGSAAASALIQPEGCSQAQKVALARALPGWWVALL